RTLIAPARAAHGVARRTVAPAPAVLMPAVLMPAALGPVALGPVALGPAARGGGRHRGAPDPLGCRGPATYHPDVPIYEYLCEGCGRISEVMQKVTDPAPKSCPECGSQ